MIKKIDKKHTDQIWKITEDIGDTPIKCLIRTLDGRLISRTYGVNPEEIEATTKLIAAAPELLESLKMMTSLCKIKHGNIDKDVYDEILKAEQMTENATKTNKNANQ